MTLTLLLPQNSHAQATRSVMLDKQGVLRWQDDSTEVALFGANYTLPSASDYRAAKKVSSDLKAMIDDDMAHFARMGWDGLRLSFWGDWENSDAQGNLIENEHLDLQDYLIAKARERGIYILFSPITTYDARWPDNLNDTTPPGFSKRYDRGALGTKPEAIAAQVNYIRQLLEHVNPYTHTALKDEPAILFIEPVNEPWHHPEDLDGSVNYINALTDAIRSTGCSKLVFYNVSQDFRIVDAIRKSKAQGLTFGWYPSGLNSNHELQGNYLRSVDNYDPMLAQPLAGLPRIVYEFDTPDLRTGYLYPAMARTFRAVGAQFAAMFAYDMMATASRNLGWQTHYLNLVYTPRKAMSAVIAAEAMRRLPRMKSYGAYPANTRFGDFRVSYDDNSSELVAQDAFIYAGTTTSTPPRPDLLKRIAGYGSSPIVTYDGLGTYFLDKVRAGVWRLEVYPDAVEVNDPFEQPRLDKIVTRAVYASREMRIRLPDLGAAFTARALGTDAQMTARNGRIRVRPGVYVLAAAGAKTTQLPTRIGRLAFSEYHAPAPDPVTAAVAKASENAPAGVLFRAGADVPRMAFTRIGDAGRRGLFRMVSSDVAGEHAFHFELPVVRNWSPADYTASLIIKDRFTDARSLSVRMRALASGQVVHVTLVEKDGTGWSAAVAADTAWSVVNVAVTQLEPARAAMLPQGFPGEWNYWMGPAQGRGTPGDAIRVNDVERLQFSLRSADNPTHAQPYGVEIATVTQQTNRVTIDATATPPAPETGFLKTGSNRSPAGHTIDVNSRYLLRDGKPWLPVMAEFHFARYPEQYWDEELAKMKAGGVQIVASYIFWIHHEEAEGQFDWTGQRNLRRFVELCQKHGLLFYARVGPWSHGEARNGGLPDWLVQKVGDRVRSNDSTYLAYVARFYDRIGAQLRGLFWKDGGPIVGVQLENEYNGTGPQRGPEHIVALKRLARASGLDAPLYSVTGWDNAVLPPSEVIPVFGGYPDWPWDQSIEKLPPNEVYAFRFENRWSGSMGAMGAQQQPHATSQQALARYPFLGAEFAGGIEDTYHRRPIIAANDVAAMLPVQLGSGVNLYGYYMFHGGTNPPGKLSTLQESQRTGYPTDVPVKSYDFQAPLGEFGEMRASFRKLKLVHYFLNEFGEQLAPMVVRQPSSIANGPADTSVVRVSARTLGDRGFIFLNNYVRDYHMPARYGFQVRLQLPNQQLSVPRQPITVPAGAYFIWPVNLDLGGTTLVYSTAQLITRVSAATSTSTYFFFAVPGIAAEFAIDSTAVASLTSSGTVERAGGRIYVSGLRPGTGAAITLRTRAGRSIRIVLLTEAQAENLWHVQLTGGDRVVLSSSDVFVDAAGLHLRSRDSNAFSFAAFPALAGRSAAGADGVFTRYAARVPAVRASVGVEKLRSADPVPPVPKFNAVTWRKVEIALAPSDSAFEHAARWRLAIPQSAFRGTSDVFLRIAYAGDVARLYAGDQLLDDNFFNGTTWQVGLKRWQVLLRDRPLELRILPLRKDAPIFIQPGYWPKIFPAGAQVADVQSIEAVPEYELLVPARVR